ncbi:MAG: glycosyltransferase family 2 protein [Actinobacteria bacterium]|nr:glycosyltransferase family 2 protein [Actinomycetota bacterium]
MVALRIVAGVAIVVLIAFLTQRYRKRTFSRLNLILTWGVGLGALAMAAVPSAFNWLFELFRLEAGGGRRMIGALFLAVLVLLFAVFRALAQADANERSLRLLIEGLAVSAFDWTQARKLPKGERIVVAMPAHNEADNIGPVIRAMPAQVEGLPVVTVVVDDASDDGTDEVARNAGAYVARLPIRRGQGMAQRVGYEIGLKLGARVVVTLDSDGQHDPGEMHLLVKPVLADEADMIQGSRMLGVFEKESHLRHAGVLFFSRLVSTITGTRITDVSSGYRAIRSDILKHLVLEQDQFSSSEVLVEGLRQHARIKEVPITIRARASGESKKPKNLRYGWNFTKVIIKTWLR